MWSSDSSTEPNVILFCCICALVWHVCFSRLQYLQITESCRQKRQILDSWSQISVICQFYKIWSHLDINGALETKVCSEIKTFRTCKSHVSYIIEDDLPAWRWAPLLAACSQQKATLCLMGRFFNISQVFHHWNSRRKSCSCFHFRLQHSPNKRTDVIDII